MATPEFNIELPTFRAKKTSALFLSNKTCKISVFYMFSATGVGPTPVAQVF